MEKRICEICGSEFEPIQEQQRYCSKKCRKKAQNARYRGVIIDNGSTQLDSEDVTKYVNKYANESAESADKYDNEYTDKEVQKCADESGSQIYDDYSGVDSYYFGMEEPVTDESDKIKQVPQSELSTIPKHSTDTDNKISGIELRMNRLQDDLNSTNRKITEFKSDFSDLRKDVNDLIDRLNDQEKTFRTIVANEFQKQLFLYSKAHEIQYVQKSEMIKLDNKFGLLDIDISNIKRDIDRQSTANKDIYNRLESIDASIKEIMRTKADKPSVETTPTLNRRRRHLALDSIINQ
jgi:chromosome segregation ATPase